MQNKIDITPEQFSIVKNILNQYLTSDIIVWAFGSRITQKAKKFSDLDLALEDKSKLKISEKVLINLRHAFDESTLPWKVDIVDYYDLTEQFQNIIDQDKVLFPKNT